MGGKISLVENYMDLHERSLCNIAKLYPCLEARNQTQQRCVSLLSSQSNTTDWVA